MQEIPQESGDGRPGDVDLTSLFQRTAAPATPIDLARLYAAAEVGAAPHGRPARPGPTRMALAIAATLLLVCGVATGWYAGRAGAERAAQIQAKQTQAAIEQAARFQSGQFEAALSETRREIADDVVRLLRATEQVVIDTQQEETKRVAVMLRDDYRTRIAALEAEVYQLAVNSYDPGEPSSMDRVSRLNDPTLSFEEAE